MNAQSQFENNNLTLDTCRRKWFTLGYFCGILFVVAMLALAAWVWSSDGPYITTNPAPMEYEITKYRIYEGSTYEEGSIDENGEFRHYISHWECGTHEITATYMNEVGESEHSDALVFTLDCIADPPVVDVIEDEVDADDGDTGDSGSDITVHSGDRDADRGCFITTVIGG